jgi:hypothetical protein
MTNEKLDLGIDMKVGGPTKMNHNIIMNFVFYAPEKLTVTTSVPLQILRVILKDGIHKTNHRY